MALPEKYHQFGRARKTPKELKLVDKLYLAGFIDGEGSISTMRQPSGTYGVSLVITNQNTKVLRWIKDTCGLGNVFKCSQSHLSNKPCFRYVVYTNQASLLLQQLEPYLKIKRKQAKLAIAMAQAGAAERLFIYNDIKKLNKGV